MENGEAYKVTSLNKFPLNFEKNIGQNDKMAKFLVRGKGYTAFFTEKEVVLTLIKIKREKRLQKESNYFNHHEIEEQMKKAEYEVCTLRISLEGARENIDIIGENEQEGRVNYLIGNDKEKWITNVPIYQRIIYKDVYPGIDVVFYGNPKQLEHDFIVKPGVNPDLINLKIEGAEDIIKDEGGNLIIKVKTGELVIKKPLAFQNNEREVESSYKFKSNNIMGFNVEKYDNTVELNIDPVLQYSTYLGGSSYEWGRAIVVDDLGSAYITGGAYLTDFPKTLEVYDSTEKCCYDAYITKINSQGTAIVYSTFLGGSDYDWGHGIAVDSSGNAFVTGDTWSSDFPTTEEALSRTLSGWNDAFVTKLNASGTDLLYSTFLGGDDFEEGFSISLDKKGNAYITGQTASKNFPTTAGAYDTTKNGSSDVFITKLTSDGTAIVYSTFLGGSSYNVAYGIVVDDLGNAYVTGATESNDFPTTIGAYNRRPNGGYDVFVTKINPRGSQLVFSTFLGGSDYDIGHGITLDKSRNVYVTGGTNSKNFPTTSGAYCESFMGKWDAFITKLNSVGTDIIYSTFIGGTDYDIGYGLVIDLLENAYITGVTHSDDFPITSGAYSERLNGFVDAFISKLNYRGTTLDYSTYFGGSSFEEGYAIAIDKNGNVYATGLTNSNDFPTTHGAYDTIYNGDGDGFVTKFST